MQLTGEGPSAWWMRFQQAGRADVVYFSWDPTVRMTLFGVMMNIFFWELCTHSSDQVAVQRYLTTPDVASARNSLWTYAGFRVALGLLLAFCGLAVFAFYSIRANVPVAEFQQQIAGQADKLMPRFIAEQLPSGIAGLLIAALLAAAMSSLSSGMNSVAGVMRSDYLPARAGESLRIDKIIVLCAGVFGMAVAATVHYAIQKTGWNLVEMTGRLNHIFVGPLASLFFAGVLSTRVSQAAALTGFVAGGLLSLYICFSSVSFTWVVPGSVTCGFLVAMLASHVFARPDEKRVANLTYSAGVR
jgi:SSS family solute:Na+ symporter